MKTNHYEIYEVDCSGSYTPVDEFIGRISANNPHEAIRKVYKMLKSSDDYFTVTTTKFDTKTNKNVTKSKKYKKNIEFKIPSTYYAQINNKKIFYDKRKDNNYNRLKKLNRILK